MEVMGTNAISQWKKVIGPEDAAEAKNSEPSSVRAMFGTDAIKNAVHGSADEKAAARVSKNCLV